MSNSPEPDAPQTAPESAGPQEDPPATTEPVTPRMRRMLRSRAMRWFVATLGVFLVLALLFQNQLRQAGREMRGSWHIAQAQKKLVAEDYAGALTELNRAFGWMPQSAGILLVRAQVRMELKEQKAALADVSRAIRLNPDLAQAYTLRGTIHQRLGQHRQAVRDFTAALERKPDWFSEPLNNRAYARAVGKIELEEGLADINQAIKLEGKDNAAYLDTRGYLLHLLGRQEEALADMDRALQLAEQERKPLLASKQKLPARVKEELNKNLAVMYHHRGLIHQKAANAEQAKNDLRLAKELGYDPAEGVY